MRLEIEAPRCLKYTRLERAHEYVDRLYCTVSYGFCMLPLKLSPRKDLQEARQRQVKALKIKNSSSFLQAMLLSRCSTGKIVARFVLCFPRFMLLIVTYLLHIQTC